MLAFHNDQAVKAKYIARVRAHRAAEELVQGTGWEPNGKTRGCAVGCTLDAYDHARYPIELGVPTVLAHLEDRLFEMLPSTAAMSWPERFLDTIPVGADLSGVWPAWAVWMLSDPTYGVLRCTGDRADVRKAVERVAELYRSGGTEKQFAEAAEAAGAAWSQVACDRLCELIAGVGQ